jgi:hypothetical protein
MSSRWSSWPEPEAEPGPEEAERPFLLYLLVFALRRRISAGVAERPRKRSTAARIGGAGAGRTEAETSSSVAWAWPRGFHGELRWAQARAVRSSGTTPRPEPRAALPGGDRIHAPTSHSFPWRSHGGSSWPEVALAAAAGASRPPVAGEAGEGRPGTSLPPCVVLCRRCTVRAWVGGGATAT